MRRVTQEQESRLIREVWPNLKAPYLGGRTPKQAAEAGDAVVALRAACCHFEFEQDLSTTPIDMAAMRASLKIPAEPEIDPETVEIDKLWFSRLRYVPVEKLSDVKLFAYFFKAREAGLPSAIERSATALAARPEYIGPRGAAYSVYTALANFAVTRGSLEDAFKRLEEGRKLDPASHRGANAPAWDMYEVNLRAQQQPPEKWVPELAIVLERYRENPQASQLLLMSMMQMGLVRMVPNPDVPGDVMLDPRTLQALLAEYGPRVTTSTGTLGVSATKGEIWTPGGPTGGGGGATSSGGIWTPGSGNPPAAGGGPDKPKLIIPGR
jgi:hypothetical protein